MRRGRRGVALLLGTALVLAATTATAAGPLRIHRLFVPPPPESTPVPAPTPVPQPTPPVALPTSLSVDLKEWAVTPSKRTVAAGPVLLQVYNRGMDDHDLTVIGADGTKSVVTLAPGAQGQLTPTLPPGDYKIYCSLFEGTPASHEALGMKAVLQVR